VLELDVRIADEFFYDASSGNWLGSGSRWAKQLIHDGGRDVIRAVVVASLVLLGGSYVVQSLRGRRHDAAFVAFSIVLSTGLVGALKSVTNVDCPWDLQHFGGTRPYIALFADRPDMLPHAACFPGAHSSSGFALLCFYFLLRDRSRFAARVACIAGLTIGVLFAFAQEARGAHFLSHDLTSAGIVWYVLLGVYVSDRRS
jgi:membrane-associated PAP2 superfamily phosphatase